MAQEARTPADATLDVSGLLRADEPLTSDVTSETVRPIEDVATEELVSRAQSGDRDAYAMIFDRFHDEIYRYATRRVGDPHVGQDVAADTFTDAFAGLGRFRWRGVPFEAWLYTIARRRVADVMRGRTRAASASVAPDVTPDPAPTVIESLDLRALVARLSDTEREVIELRFMEDLDVEQTALRLGKQTGAVRVAQHRALNRLRLMTSGGTA